MERRDFLKSMAAAAVGITGANICGFGNLFAQGSKDSKPNILFIFADDQCFETIAAMGNKEIQTPNLDRLVRNGTAFSHTYIQGGWHGAICVASRTMINTGRFLWNSKNVFSKLDSEGASGRMWAPIMRNAGYETYMTGKWHLDCKVEPLFDNVKDVRPGMPAQTKQGYNRPIEGQPDKWSPYDEEFGGYWKGGKHWSEVLAEDAEQFINQAAKKDKPFFMYIAFNAAHDPRQSPKEYVDKYPMGSVSVPENFIPENPDKDYIGCSAKLRDEALAPFPRTEYAIKVNRQEYYALITHMDVQIGKILDTLEKSGKADKTYIFFGADNGLAIGHHGFVGKQNMYEDSMRVPMMVCGPNIPKGKKLDMPVYLQDIMPTTLELAGIAKPDHVQFKSLMPLIKGQKTTQYDAMYAAYMPTMQRMVLKDGYKLIMYPALKKYLLYHVATDPMEMKNIADQESSKPIVADLFKTFQQLQKETNDPLVINISEYSAKGTIPAEKPVVESEDAGHGDSSETPKPKKGSKQKNRKNKKK